MSWAMVPARPPAASHSTAADFLVQLFVALAVTNLLMSDMVHMPPSSTPHTLNRAATQHVAGHPLIGSREQPVEVLAHDPIALAGCGLQAGPVYDSNGTAAVAD